jgi:hypothetical protein
MEKEKDEVDNLVAYPSFSSSVRRYALKCVLWSTFLNWDCDLGESIINMKRDAGSAKPIKMDHKHAK